MRLLTLRCLPLSAATLLAAACAAPPPSPGPAGAAPASPAAPSAAGQPPADGFFRYRMREDPPSLDPAKGTDTQSAAVLLRVFDGLVEFEPLKLAVRPAVAKSWTVSADGKVYDFKLRDDVLFHTGRKVTADDVVYSFNRVFETAVNSERRWVLEPILGAKALEDSLAKGDGKVKTLVGVEAVAPDEVRVRLEQPYAPFLGQLCMEAASIVPKEIYEDAAKAYLRHPVGCGPFQFVEWQQGNYLKVAAFDKYYKGKPKLAGITYRFIADMATAVEEYRNGGLEMVDEVPPGQRQRLARELPGEYHRWSQLGSYSFAFNALLPPFAGNLKLRQAFELAVDRKYICGTLQEGLDTPAYGWIPPGLPGHRPEADQDPYDPDKAKQLLADAGYPGGKGLPPIKLWTNTREDHLRIAQQVQADLAKIGVQVEIGNQDWAAYLSFVQGTPTENTTAQFFRQGWVADYPDADNFMTINLSKSAWGPAGNYSRYSNPAFEDLIAKARVETDVAARTRMYEQADKLATDDAALLFIYFYGDDMLLKNYVMGFAESPQGDYTAPMDEVWFEPSAAGAPGTAAAPAGATR